MGSVRRGSEGCGGGRRICSRDVVQWGLLLVGKYGHRVELMVVEYRGLDGRYG